MAIKSLSSSFLQKTFCLNIIYPLQAASGEDFFFYCALLFSSRYVSRISTTETTNVKMSETGIEYKTPSKPNQIAEEPRVRITALPVENRITFEAVYSAQKKQKKRTPATKSSVNDLVHKLFEPKKPQVLGMEVVRGILERYSGAMDLSAAGGSEILRIIINN